MPPNGFRDLDEVLGRPAKQLPVGGKTYTFPDRVSAETGRKLLRITQKARHDPDAALDGETLMREFFTDTELEQLQDELLGDAHEQMIDDGVPGEHIIHVFQTLTVWHLFGLDAALKAWEVRPGEASAPNRAARRAPKATAKSTRSRGSTSGTTSRARAAKKGSAGRSSSSTGR